MEKIFTEKSLRFIINSINLGLVEYQSLESLTIVSDKKPEFFLKIIDIDITDYISSLISKTSLKSEIDFCETNFFDFIVFVKAKDAEEKTTLNTISLLELITVSNKLTTEDKQTRIEPVDENIWSLDSDEWNLIEEKI